ncbi:MAG: putative dual-specificity RNA methyltransferase RlmN [candidate division TM6 bacterium GW2011_GWF2_37_49]|nr:MAG: putative dual-specificity RNA methyltransferase RlmN [candidate division TM6 bacterium GW2011_GWF2_37_49]
MKKHILDLSLSEFTKEIELLGLPKFRAAQIWDWVYNKHVFSFAKMTSLPQVMLPILEQTFSIFIPEIEAVSESKTDKSFKFLLKAEDGKLFEAILMIASAERATVCVSCMVGCPLKCKFCATGSEVTFARKLSAAEILSQIFIAQKYALDNKLASKITNIVFMGMGEPFLNIPGVERAIAMLLSPDGFAMSKSRITISTAGVDANFANVINKLGVKLAVSLHFPNDALRSQFMPVNKSFPLAQLVAELKKIKLSKRETITIEYIMIDGVNDQVEHAKQLINLVGSLKVKFNLIPYNPTKMLNAKPSSDDQINKFAAFLNSKSFMVTVRRSKGIDVDGGCGQFALKRG